MTDSLDDYVVLQFSEKSDFCSEVINAQKAIEMSNRELFIDPKSKTWQYERDSQPLKIGEARETEEFGGEVIGVYDRRNTKQLSSMVRHWGKIVLEASSSDS